MGTFERIRQISPYFFGLFALLLVAYFIFTSGGEEIAQTQRETPQTAVIATINGEDVLRMEFEKRVAERREQMRSQQQQKGQESEQPDIDENAIRKQVWEEMVEETLMNQEAAKAGIIVTNDEISDVLVENPPEVLTRMFTDTARNFNRQVYLEIITNPDAIANYMGDRSPEEKVEAVKNFRHDLIMISDYLKKQKLAERLNDVLSFASFNYSISYAEEKYIGENSTSNVNYIMIDISNIPENNIKVSDSEIKNYYEAHMQYYKQKPQRKIKYVTFPIVPSKADSNKAHKRMELILSDLEKGTTIQERDSIFDNLLNQFNGTTSEFAHIKDLPQEKMNYLLQLQDREVIGPVTLPTGNYFFRLDKRRTGENEVVKASHILVTSNNNKDSAKKEILNIMSKINGGMDFAVAASMYSTDPGSARQGGDLGYFSHGQMVKEFDSAAFKGNIGEIVGPVETDYGYHLIKIFDKKSEEIAYSEIQIVPTISSITTNLLKREALSFKSQVEKGTNFDTLAKRLKLIATETALFDNSRPILGSQYLTNVSFENEVGTVLEPFELKYYGLIVAQVTDSREEGVKPLEDVKETIKTKVLKIKRLDALKPEAERIYSQVISANSLDAPGQKDSRYIAKNVPDMKNAGMVPGIGQSYAMTAEAFKLPIGKFSEPIRDDKGYFIIQVLSRNVPDKNKVKAELKDYIAQQKAAAKQNLYYQWMNKIREEAEIIDKRSKYYIEY